MKKVIFVFLVGIFFSAHAEITFENTSFFNVGDASQPYMQAVETFDYNGDIYDDLIILNDEDEIQLFTGNGDGTYNYVATYPISPNARDMSVGDFNGDMMIDVAVVHYKSGSGFSKNLSVLLNNGNNAFNIVDGYYVGDNGETIQTADLNKDGVLDIVTSSRADNAITLLYGNGDGTFGKGPLPGQTYGTGQDFAAGNNPFGLAIADLDGNTFLDIVVTNFLGNNLSIFMHSGFFDGNGYPIFNTSTTDVSIPIADDEVTNYYNGNSYLPTSVAAADFDNDGNLDLAVSLNGGKNANFDNDWPPPVRNISILFGNGDGTFPLANADFYQANSGSKSYKVLPGDFNGDGNIDLASISYNYYSNPGTNARVNFFENDPNNPGQFILQDDVMNGGVDSETNVGDFTLAQVDGDGIDDMIAVGMHNSNKAIAFLNTSEQGPLPISLLYFVGENTEEGNRLSWATAAEQNNDYFIIERSSDLVHFEEITQVNGAGTSNSRLYYEYLDLVTLEGPIYYRLTQVDYDGQYERFPAIMVSSQRLAQLKVYPNPSTSSDVYIEVWSYDAEPGTLTILDAYGNEVLTVEAGHKKAFNIESKYWKSGMYIINYQSMQARLTCHMLVN